MSKSRTSRGDKEYDQLDKLKHDNKKLKRQVKKLRKIIDRFDLDRYNDVKEWIEKYANLELEQERAEATKELEKRWKCWDCDQGVFRIHVIMRMDGEFYYRMCDQCRKRTSLKKYSKKTEGVE